MQKKPGRASRISVILMDGADIGTCKISAQLDQWLLRNSHQKTVTTQLDLLRLNWIDCIVIKDMDTFWKSSPYIRQTLNISPYISF